MKEIVLVVLQEEDNCKQFTLRRRVVPFSRLQASGPVRDHPFLTVLLLGQYAADGSRVDAEIGVQDERLPVELWVGQDRGGHQLLLHYPKSLDSGRVLMKVGNPLMLVLFGVLDQGSRESGVISDEPPVVATFPQECPQGFDVVGDRPFLDYGGVLRGNTDSLGTDFVSQVFDVILEQLGLLGGDLKSRSSEGCQHLAEDPEVAPSIGGVHSHVVKVAEDLRRWKMSQSFNHQLGVGGGSIRQAEGHFDELILAKG